MSSLARTWWIHALRGAAALLLGVVWLAASRARFEALAVMFGAYAVSSGMLSVGASLSSADRGERWPGLLWSGSASVAAGLVSIAWLAMTIPAFRWVLVAWAAVTGAGDVAAALRLRRFVPHEWFMLVGGAASIAYAITLSLRSGASLAALAWTTGLFAIVLGLAQVALGLRLRSVLEHLGVPARA